MKRSQLRARYWRIVFFFARVTAGFIWWEIFLPRIGMGGLEFDEPARSATSASRFVSARSPSAWAA